MGMAAPERTMRSVPAADSAYHLHHLSTTARPAAGGKAPGGNAGAQCSTKFFTVMKERTIKSSGRTASGLKSEKTSHTISSRTGGTSSRGTACSRTPQSGRVSRSNNPEGHNQYTKK